MTPSPEIHHVTANGVSGMCIVAFLLFLIVGGLILASHNRRMKP